MKVNDVISLYFSAKLIKRLNFDVHFIHNTQLRHDLLKINEMFISLLMNYKENLKPIHFPLRIIVVFIKEICRRSLGDFYSKESDVTQRTKCFEMAIAEVKRFLLSRTETAKCNLSPLQVHNLKTYPTP